MSDTGPITAGIRATIVAVPASASLCGCTRAPSISVLGAYFPSWMFCVLIAGMLSALTAMGLAFAGVSPHLRVPVLTYVTLTAMFTFIVWLVWLG